MKKLLFLLATVGVIFTACQSGGDVEEDNGGTPFVPEITISPKDLTFGCNGGEQAVDITANFEYEVAERASWVTVEQTDEGLLVIVDANKNTSERSAFISITNSQYDINKTVEVWQEGFVPKIELAQQSIEVEFEPAECEVGVTSPYSWEATSKNDWIIVDTPNGIAGTKMLKFSVVRNEGEDIREGTIVVKNEDYNLVAELYVIQKPISITINPESLTFAVEGGTQEIAITANFEYAYSANADWLTIEKSESGIKVTVPNYVEVEERTAEITISNEKYGVSEVAKVTQGAFVPAITIEPESLAFTLEGGTQEVAITANFEYEYSTNVDWLTIEKSEKGVNISATPNTKFEECIAEITISSEKYGISKTISVVQKGVSAKPENVIIYTSSNGKIVTPNNSNVFGANIESNTYRDGQGIIIFDAPVTSIGDSAFYKCTSLTSVTITDGVTSIGSYAFAGCTALKAFYGKFASSDNRCLIVSGRINSFAPAGLTEYTIPDSVTSIGASAFAYCSKLTSITIPGSVTSIGESAFRDCTSLTSVTIPDSVTSIGERAFYHCTSLTSITIPDSVTSIGVAAFSCCTSLTSITIPNSVTSIGRSAFSYCHSLTSVTIPDGVTEIGNSTFYNCFSLTSVTIPDSVTSIGEYAFAYCSSLTSVTITDSVTSIGFAAFYGCSSLKAFYGNFASSDNRCLIVDGVLNSFAPAALTQYTIPDSVTSIGNEAFCGCSSLKSVTIPNSVTSIGDDAFRSCTSLTSVTIGNSVTSIGDDAFRSCTSLTSVTIGNSVTSIGYWAFYNCTSLTSVYCKPTTPPKGSSDMFYNNASGRKIYVPRNSVEAYKSASYWRSYASYIEGYDF